jgi:hypothetical protein
MKLKTQGLPEPLYTSVEVLYNNLFTGAAMIFRKTISARLVVLALMACVSVLNAQQSPGPGARPATVMPDVVRAPAAAQPSEHFDADAATNAYLAQSPPAPARVPTLTSKADTG